MTPPDRIAPSSLAALELFHGLALPVLEAAAASARVASLPGEARIFNQGDEGVRVHAVVEGAVRIAQSGSDGGQVVVRFIGPGEMFGAVSLFTDGRYPADAITLARTLEVSWSEAEWLALISRYPLIATNLVRIIGKRLQDAQNRLLELATQRAERRIAHAILRLAAQAGHATVDGATIDLPLRRRDVADITGASLFTASRILTAWERVGLLTTDHRHLTLHDPAEIRRIADDDARAQRPSRPR